MEECAKLAQYVESHTPDNGKQPEKMAAVQLLTFLGQSFSTLVDIALGILVGVRTSQEYTRTSTRTRTLRVTMFDGLALTGPAARDLQAAERRQPQDRPQQHHRARPRRRTHVLPHRKGAFVLYTVLYVVAVDAINVCAHVDFLRR